jgi:hypothetical protein
VLAVMHNPGQGGLGALTAGARVEHFSNVLLARLSWQDCDRRGVRPHWEGAQCRKCYADLSGGVITIETVYTHSSEDFGNVPAAGVLPLPAQACCSIACAACVRRLPNLSSNSLTCSVCEHNLHCSTTPSILLREITYINQA